jgi:hypothetical protein
MREKKVTKHHGRMVVPKLKLHIDGHEFRFDFNNLLVDKSLSVNMNKRNVRELINYLVVIDKEMVYYVGY